MVVDEDCGIPTALVEDCRSYSEGGPLAQSDPRSVLLSMSEYNKSQNYELYGESIYNSAMCLVVALAPGRAAESASPGGVGRHEHM